MARPSASDADADRPVDWEQRWSREARAKQLPSLHGIVSRFTSEPGVIGMHGGLPAAATFPLTSLRAGLLRLREPGTAACDSPELPEQLVIDDPALVSAAQQYNMQAKGYAPLVSWARELVVRLHRPASLSSGVGLDTLVTPGSSAALDSLVRVLVEPGDPVLLEEFTYAHVAEAHLLPLGCELLALPLDACGLVPSALDDLLTARQAAGQRLPRVLYTIPNGQNPTGCVLSAERMAVLYRLAQKWDLVIIEDDAYFWLQFPHGPDAVPGLNLTPGFLSLDTDGRVVRVDTLAKLLGPGHRLGWLCGAPPLVHKVSLYTAGISVGANMVSQVLVHQLLSAWGIEGFEAYVTRLQGHYARQAALAQAAARKHLGGRAALAEWQPVRAGMFMWLRLTARAGDAADSEALLAAAVDARVSIIPGHLISVPHLAAAHARRQAQQAGAAPLEQLLQQAQLQLDALASSLDAAGGSADADPRSAADALAGLAAALRGQQRREGAGGGLLPCPYFRVSLASVSAADMEAGFARLRAAIVATRSEAPACEVAQPEPEPPTPVVHEQLSAWCRSTSASSAGSL